MVYLYFRTGVGKTCTAVTISEAYKDKYVRDNKKINRTYIRKYKRCVV